jgi:MarR family transcriptional regulator, organic hydroperoxide resistance regulator
LIASIRHKTDRFLVRQMKLHNLNGIVPSHGDILSLLLRKESMPMKDIAATVEKDKSTVTTLVDKLVKMGYVEKRQDNDDNRVTLVSLTDKGKALKKDFREISERLVTTAYKNIPLKEREALIIALQKINSNF